MSEMQKVNSDPSIPMIVVGILFLCFSCICLLFPEQVQKVDIRLRKYIKKDDEYRAAIQVFGIIFLLISIALLLIGGLILLGIG